MVFICFLIYCKVFTFLFFYKKNRISNASPYFCGLKKIELIKNDTIDKEYRHYCAR